jgi:S-formylglutathione hydrolase FrmB
MLITATSLLAQTPQSKPTPLPKPVTTPQRSLNVAETWAAMDAPDVRTLKLNSKLMGREMTYRVIMPRDYESLKDSRFPVIYLLHGLSGHYDNWTEKTKVGDYVRDFGYFIVTPEAGDGWYTDSVTVPNDKFESYIIQELIPEIDKNFRTKTARSPGFQWAVTER